MTAPWTRVTAAAVTAAVVTLGLVVIAVGAWFLAPERLASFGLTSEVDEATLTVQIREFCGACHALPSPESLPRASWGEEIPKAYARYKSSGRQDLIVPSQPAVTRYYSNRAVEWMVIADAPESRESPLPFRVERVDLPPDLQGAAVSFLGVEQTGAGQGSATRLLLCDMLNGAVRQFGWERGQAISLPLAQLQNPDHIVACDFDRDGLQDYLVAELGALMPTDELNGAVVLLRATGQPEGWELIRLHTGIGRVADAQMADLDADGDNDVVVAEFGFEKAGSLFWLETVSIENGRPVVVRHEIDPRHGAIHVPVTDIDADGDLDVIALISQEHETIVAFLNDGHGRFEKRTLFDAGTPSFGSSGMELADMDQDGDIDLLFTNGDTLDTFQLKPFHAVNWLENRGDGQFQKHKIETLPGAVRAVAVDLDEDGLKDIVAVAFCPPMLRHMVRPNRLDTLVWLRQTAPGQFERHALPLETPTGSMAVAAGDFDSDGDVDLAVGEFAPFTPTSRQWFSVYWNPLRDVLVPASH
jgi:hypothetical protein